MSVISTSRKHQDKLLKSSEAAEVVGNRQEEPINLKANPAYLSVSNTPQLTMSADAVYSTIDEVNDENVLPHNHDYFVLEKSVASF